MSVLESKLFIISMYEFSSKGLNDYTYDDYGNMTVDNNKGITNIRYNHLNLPTEITFNGNSQTRLNYTYTNYLYKIV